MIHFCLTIIFFIAFQLICSAQETVNCDKFSPEWITLGITDSQAIKQSVTWRSAKESNHGEAQIVVEKPSLEKAGVGLIFNPSTQNAISKVYNDYGIEKKYHRIVFSNLQPDTRYLYRVGNDGCWSEWFQFKTAKKEPDMPFSFLYFGDVQYGISNLYPRVIRQSIMKAAEASFMIFAGDLTGNATEKEFNDFFKAGGWILATKSVAPIPDGHEYRENAKGEKRAQLTTLWNHMFTFPETAPPELNKMGNYFFDYQNARFIMINSYDFLNGNAEKINSYKTWLESILKNNTRKWTIVTHHIPLYPIAARREKIEHWYNMLKPLYDEYGVDLVLSGHDHGYARGGINLQDKKRKAIKGPVYVVSVAGTNKYELANRDWYDRIIPDTQLFQHIKFSGNQMEFLTYTAMGYIYDEFWVIKKGNRKVFADKTPEPAN